MGLEPVEGLRPIGDVLRPIWTRMTRTIAYTARDGLIYGIFDPRGLTTLEARARLANHAENAIAGVCDDESALDLIHDLIRAIRAAEGGGEGRA